MLKDSLIIIPNFSAADQVCDFVWQTARHLAKNNRVFVLNYYESPEASSPHTDQGVVRVIYHKSILPLRRFALINRLNKWLYFAWLQLFLTLKYRQAKKRYIWMFFPELADLLKAKIVGWQVIFDIVDYHFSPDEAKMRELEVGKRLLLSRADHLFSISKVLQKKYQLLAKRPIHLVPQGFDVTSFAAGRQESKLHLPSGKPLIGFVGQLSERLDFKLLDGLLAAHPEWNFVFVGPMHHEPNVALDSAADQIESLRAHKNFHHLPRQPRASILDLLRKFDVCIIPYDVSFAFNRYCYPMKLFEYFYAGQPIVSTPIEELRRFPDLVSLASDDLAYAQAIKSALIEPWPREKAAKQRKLAEGNSWGQKLKQVSEFL